MSIYQEVNEINNKLEHFNKTFKNRIETLNDEDITEKDINKWNDSKKNIQKTISKLNNIANQYIKQTNTAISQFEPKDYPNVNYFGKVRLKKTNHKKMYYKKKKSKFGADDDADDDTLSSLDLEDLEAIEAGEERGEEESGERESGERESEERESGERESGERESGERESGERESGEREEIVLEPEKYDNELYIYNMNIDVNNSSVYYVSIINDYIEKIQDKYKTLDINDKFDVFLNNIYFLKYVLYLQHSERYTNLDVLVKRHLEKEDITNEDIKFFLKWAYKEGIKHKNEFFIMLKETNSYIAGGYFHMIMHEIDSYLYRDMDIYVNQKNSEEILKYFYDKEALLNLQLSSAYNESFFEKNGILSRTKVKLDLGYLYDVILVKNNVDIVKTIIPNFDLSYCSVYYDSQNGIIKGNINQLNKKEGKLNKDYLKYLTNSFIQNRLKKYEKRGYITHIKGSINLKSGKRDNEINDKTIIKYIFKKLYQKYSHSRYKHFVIKELSVDYTINNLINTTKNISNKIYGSNDMQIIMILNVIESINNMNQKVFIQGSGLDDSELSNPARLNRLDKGKIYSEKLEEVKNNLIEYAEQNNIPLNIDEKYTNLILKECFLSEENFSNYLIENYNLELVININNEESEDIELGNNNIIHLLKNLYNLEDNIYILNFIYVIFYKFIYVKHRYNHFSYISSSPNDIEKYIKIILNYKLDNLWLGNVKIRSAINFNKDISLNLNLEYKPNFDVKQLLYFDIFMVEELPYDEVIEDKDNLLFILPNKSAFTYNYEILIKAISEDYFLECNKMLNQMPIEDDVNINKWYVKLTGSFNLLVTFVDLFYIMSIYENTNKGTRIFYLDNKENLDYVTSVNALGWDRGQNMWREYVNLVSETHCGSGMVSYNSIKYIETPLEE